MNPDHDDEMSKRLSDLDTRLGKLESDFSRLVKVTEGFNDLLRKHLHMHDTELADAFFRIKNIELNIFPNLVNDIRDLGRVIGEGDDSAHNPLDRRKP